jgi:hypothetical protein
MAAFMFWIWLCGCSGEQTRVAKPETISRIEMARRTIVAFEIAFDSLPSTLADACKHGEMCRDVSQPLAHVDEWGQSFEYTRLSADHFSLRSSGQDRVAESQDDYYYSSKDELEVLRHWVGCYVGEGWLPATVMLGLTGSRSVYGGFSVVDGTGILDHTFDDSSRRWIAHWEWAPSNDSVDIVLSAFHETRILRIARPDSTGTAVGLNYITRDTWYGDRAITKKVVLHRTTCESQ